jgi:CRP/FNR family transcriptional regulator, cyclic AMP receptor protein
MVGRAEVASRLEKVWLFASCSERDRSRLAKLGTVEELPAGTVLMKRGERARDFYVVLKGQVRVELSGNAPFERGPGSALGEMALVDGGPRSATATAVTDVTVFRVRKSKFEALLREVPSVAIKLIETLGLRLRTANREIARLRTGETVRPPRASDIT